MPENPSFLFLEYRKFTRKGNLVIIFVFVALLLLMMNAEMNRLKSNSKDILSSRKTEEVKTTQFQSYTPYGMHGHILSCLPNGLTFLRPLNIYGNLKAHIDSGIGLKLYTSQKRSDVLPDPSSGYLSFSGLIMIIGGLLSLMYGSSSYKNKKDLKFLCTIKPFSHVFWKILFARMLFLTATILILLVCTVILAFLNRINILNSHYLYYYWQAFLFLNLCLAAGTTFGSMKNKFIGTVLLIGLFSLNTLSPWFIYIVSDGFSNTTPEHQVELDKLKILMAFERRGVKQFGNLRSGKEFKELVRGFFDSELVLIEDTETKYKNSILENQKRYRTLSTIIPGSFFVLNALEVSGQGFYNYSNFYGFAEQQKHEFIKFYADKSFLSENAPEEVQSFVKGDSNVFYSRPAFPVDWLTGTVLNLLYTALFIFFTYRNTYRNVYPKTETMEDEEEVYIPVDRKKTTVFFTTFETLKEKIYNHFAGKEKIKGEIDLSPEKDFKDPNETGFTFISNDLMKEISPAALHRFLFGEKPGKNMDHWDVLFKYGLTKKLVLFDEFLKTRPDKLADFTLQLKEKNVASLILSSDYFFTEHFVDENTPFGYYADEPLAGTLKKLKDFVEKKGAKSHEEKEDTGN